VTFYLITHVLLGLIAGNHSRVLMGHRSIASLPLWALTSNWLSVFGIISIFCALASIPITFFKWGFFWGLLTIAEVLIGMLLATLIPVRVGNLMLLFGPVVSLILCGALLGFWFVPLPALILVLIVFALTFLWQSPARLHAGSSGYKAQGNSANSRSSSPTPVQKGSKRVVSVKKQNRKKIETTTQGKARASSKLKARAVLLKKFRYSLEEKAIPFFESIVSTIEKQNGNEHDVAVNFMLARLDQLVPKKGSDAELFVKQNSHHIHLVLKECSLDTEAYIKRLNVILKRHEI